VLEKSHGTPGRCKPSYFGHFGSILGSVEELWGESICLAYALQKISNTSAVAHTVGDAVDHFQASIYNALTGYYRLGFTSLRAVVENMTLAAYFDIAATHDEFAAWLAGEDFRFGRAADNLLQYAHIADLEEKLRVATGDNLYRQRTETDPGGFVRRLFRELSKFAHGAPGYSDGDMWRSNRPIFVAEVFETWTEYFLAVYSLTVLQSRLADQQLRHLAFDSAFTARELFRHVIQRMSRKSEARTLLGALPDDIW